MQPVQASTTAQLQHSAALISDRLRKIKTVTMTVFKIRHRKNLQISRKISTKTARIQTLCPNRLAHPCIVGTAWDKNHYTAIKWISRCRRCTVVQQASRQSPIGRTMRSWAHSTVETSSMLPAACGLPFQASAVVVAPGAYSAFIAACFFIFVPGVERLPDFLVNAAPDVAQSEFAVPHKPDAEVRRPIRLHRWKTTPRRLQL